MERIKKYLISIVILALIIAAGAAVYRYAKDRHAASGGTASLTELVYDGDIAVEINGNVPVFTDEELSRAENGFESYSRLDSLGRCGVAEASVCLDTMPAEDEKRTGMGSIYPTGWQSISFWSRCHLIGWQLTAENANERNLITGTTRLNMSGMLPYENMVAKYIGEHPGGHVLYRVEPLFKGRDLVASGVTMQAESVEDKGRGLSFNVYVFNYQPGYIIDYMDGTVEDDPDHQTVITIADKRAAYTGEPVSTDPAKVEGSTGDIRYIYYTDRDAKERTTESDGSGNKGSAPACRGRYYVRAVVSGDNWYPAAASNVAELTIY